jgi:hypothetical protein
LIDKRCLSILESKTTLEKSDSGAKKKVKRGKRQPEKEKNAVSEASD